MISATLVDADPDQQTYMVSVAQQGGREDAEFRVTLRQDLYQQLCAGGVTHEWVIVSSFKFLLAREDVGQILSVFDLAQISDYFPEYVATLQEELLQKG